MKQFNFCILIALWITFLTGCSDPEDGDDTVPSKDISTGNIYSTFQVIVDGSEFAYIEAQLTIGGPPRDNQSDSFVILESGDELWFSTGENIDDINFSGNIFENFGDLNDKQALLFPRRIEKVTYEFLFRRSIINKFGKSYSAQLPVRDSPEYRVVFLRENGQNAVDSTINMPKPFVITSPSGNARISRSTDAVEVEWNNTDPDATMKIEAFVSCTDGIPFEFTDEIKVDSGSFTIPAGTLDMPSLNGQCTVTLNVRRSRAGSFDARFIGGAVNGHQVRRIAFITEE